MSVIDKELELSNEQAITATARSTNVIDLSVAKDIGPGTPLPFLIKVIEAFNNLTDLTIALQVDNDVAFGSPTTVISKNMLLAELVAGAPIPGFERIPDGVDERYMSILFTVNGAAPTLGTIYAAFVEEGSVGTNKANL